MAEPFLIREISWDQDAGIIEFVCYPDAEAAKTPPNLDEIDPEHHDAAKMYHKYAVHAVADGIMLHASISSEHARVETLLKISDYEKMVAAAEIDAADYEETNEDEATDERIQATAPESNEAQPKQESKPNDTSLPPESET